MTKDLYVLCTTQQLIKEFRWSSRWIPGSKERMLQMLKRETKLQFVAVGCRVMRNEGMQMKILYRMTKGGETISRWLILFVHEFRDTIGLSLTIPHAFLTRLHKWKAPVTWYVSMERVTWNYLHNLHCIWPSGTCIFGTLQRGVSVTWAAGLGLV